ncbi:MAG TPA: glycosyltransferase, partial [Gemmataceae bacterium]|nr:glycosyltransferase [Gemmataceae bacterium]
MPRAGSERNGGPRVLLLSVAMGSGHVRAAQALELAWRRLVPGATVQNVDLLELTNRLFRFFYGDFYLYLVQHHPHVLRWIYDNMDRPSWARKAYEHANMHGLVDLLEREPWDLIISTHFLPAEVIANLREEGRLATPDVTVITDFEAHSMWCVRPCDLFCVATEEAARFVAAHGIPRDNVRVTGIPIHPVFAERKDRQLCLARHGLIGHRPVVLQLAGAHGVGPIAEVYRGLLDVEPPLELVVVTGHNEEARQHLEGLPRPGRHRVTVLGYTDAMDELLTAADLVVSKAGGLTVSEALARGTPLVIVDPI